MNRVEKGKIWKPHLATVSLPVKGKYLINNDPDNKKFEKVIRSMQELRSVFGSKVKEKWVCDEKETIVYWKLGKGAPMLKYEARKTVEDSFVYLVDCTLATVSPLASLKKKTKSEYRRQKDIAQFGISRIKAFNLNPENTRAETVITKFDGNVDDWANFIESKEKRNDDNQ